jgi:hypothetical protein
MTRSTYSVVSQIRSRTQLGFDWAVVALSLWLVGGVHLDAWAHHQFDETLETFFTPWHGVLYSGFLVLAALIVGRVIVNWRRAHSWRESIPAGYRLALLGIGIFLVGGVGDMLWHLLFGIEVNVEALLSPTHLLLALGAGLMVTGPVRSALTQPTFRWPALVGLALLLAVFSFFTAFANPLSDGQFASGLRPANLQLASSMEGQGVAAILLQTFLWLGVTLFAVRQWRLPFGAMTVLFGLSSLLTVSVHQVWYFLPATFVTGLAADVLVQRWQATPQRRLLRLVAFLVPALFYALYFLTVALEGGVWWRVHLWGGSIVMAGLLGWLLSYAFFAP